MEVPIFSEAEGSYFVRRMPFGFRFARSRLRVVTRKTTNTAVLPKASSAIAIHVQMRYANIMRVRLQAGVGPPGT